MKLIFYSVVVILAFSTGCTRDPKTSGDSKIASSENDNVAKSTVNASVNCSEAYGGKEASCERIQCSAKYMSFIGKWEGEFSSYVREKSTNDKSIFRPYHNIVTYSEADCLKNIVNGETFIIGRRTDSYSAFDELPASEKKGLLITGKKSDGSPFLRTVDEDGYNDYTLVYQNEAANLSIWDLHIPANGENPEMTFTTIDGQDFGVTTAHKRNVTVSMKVGPTSSPMWQSIIAFGSHTKQN